MAGPANALNITEAGFQSFDGVSVFHGRTLTAGAGVTISNGSGVAGNPIISLTGGAVALEHLTGNSGGALNPDGANNINIVTANTTVKFVGSGSTLTQDFSLTNLMLGASGASITTATKNVAFGNLALIAVTSSTESVAVGFNALKAVTTSPGNVGVGYDSLLLVTTGSGYNVAIGAETLNAITTGAFNVAIGRNAGTLYTGAETNNILIGYNVNGTLGESNVIRLGSTNHTSCFITGIDGVNVGSVAKIVTETSNQLGTATITAGTGITITPTANTITVTNSGLAQVVIQLFDATGTYTPTAGMKYCVIEIVGGGGGGGGVAATAATTVASASGGAAGSFSKGVFSAATIGASQAVTIATPAAAGGIGNNPGTAGGTSSVGALITAPGGGGGNGSAAGVAPNATGGLSGASGTGGSVNIAGNPGGASFGSQVGAVVVGGCGGNSFYGAGGVGNSTGIGGGAGGGSGANIYGAGGAGAYSGNNGAGANGGAGSKGVVVITEYI